METALFMNITSERKPNAMYVQCGRKTCDGLKPLNKLHNEKKTPINLYKQILKNAILKKGPSFSLLRRFCPIKIL